MRSQRLNIVPFFLLSLSVHLAFLLAWSNAPKLEQKPLPIPVRFLPAPEKTEAVKKDEPIKPARESQLSKRTTPAQRSVPKAAKITPQSSPAPAAENVLPEGFRFQPDETKKASPAKQMDQSIVQRPLPSLKELLPPFSTASTREGLDREEEVIRLDSTDPNYISYLASVKRNIELVWEYPPPALREGLQGRLVVEFRIKKNGSLMEARLVRSSGYPILDDEAIRAIQAAAPFHPIPRWIGKERLAISASFEYYDNRLNYSFTP